MKAILAVNAAGYIGNKGQLLWHCKEDLAHFKLMVEDSQNSLLVGHNTAKKLPKLKCGKLVIDRLGALLPNAAAFDWCIGGRKTYERYAHLFTELHVSTIIDNWRVGDTAYPTLILSNNCKIYNYYYLCAPNPNDTTYANLIAKQKKLQAAVAMLHGHITCTQILYDLTNVMPKSNIGTIEANIAALHKEVQHLQNNYSSGSK